MGEVSPALILPECRDRLYPLFGCSKGFVGVLTYRKHPNGTPMRVEVGAGPLFRPTNPFRGCNPPAVCYTGGLSILGYTFVGRVVANTVDGIRFP